MPRFWMAVLTIFPVLAFSQGPRTQRFTITETSVRFDSLSIAFGSVQVAGLPMGSYTIDHGAARLTITDPAIELPLSVVLTYTALAADLSAPYLHKSTALIGSDSRIYNPFKPPESKGSRGLATDWGEVEKRGSISRGIGVGSNQSLSLNSSLNLQLNGKLNERVSLLAAITDENIPIEPDGNTQQLQDFDRVYIQVFDSASRLTVGDFQSAHQSGTFLRFNKKHQGLQYEYNNSVAEKAGLTVVASASVSRGKFARQIIQGVEANQGPYRLVGAEGEQFISVLSGTERVFVDGRLLVRGQDMDYVVNYNTAEVVFTARVPITKDRRIVVEFQYADRNYARSLLYSAAELKTTKSAARLAIFSEQDARNQPLQQDLTDAQRAVLETVGDSTAQAFASSIDTATFAEGRLLYRLVDTVYFDAVLSDSVVVKQVLVHSTAREGQFFDASFAEVGFGKGNYVLQEQLAAGRIYRWVPPMAGVPQGTHEPVVFLVTPKRRQMAVVGGSHSFDNGLNVAGEWAGSYADQNTFSPAGDGNNAGHALKAGTEWKRPLNSDWQLNIGSGYEFLQRRFVEVERWRPVEFDRDWNLRGLSLKDDQHLMTVSAALVRNQALSAKTAYKLFDAGAAFRGQQIGADLSASKGGVAVNFNNSFTSQNGSLVNARYYQHNSLLKVPVAWLQLGFKDDFEQNELMNASSDSLLPSAFKWWEWEASAQTPDSSQWSHRASYSERTDWLPNGKALPLATFARTYGYALVARAGQSGTAGFRFNYRRLRVADSTLTIQKPENTLVGRLDHSQRFFRGAITTTTFYEVGSGLENRREFLFLETTAGLGTHIFNDYNSNGIRELNEFEIAQQADQVASANFIKVFVPTADYVKVLSNVLSHSMYLKAPSNWRSAGAVKRLVARFSNQFAFNSDRKTVGTNVARAYDPLGEYRTDSTVQSQNTTLRDVLFFNAANPTFGADINYQRATGRSLLVNGYEQRWLEKTGAGVRWNFSAVAGAELRGESGTKGTSSDAGALAARQFNIAFSQLEPRLSVQPSQAWRIAGFLTYREQQNFSGDVKAERSISRRLGTELTYSAAKHGNIQAQFAANTVSFNGNVASTVAYEMLEGLQPGVNFTWGAQFQRTLAGNLQINMGYNGRQSPGLAVIHTGNVQARAFF